MKRKLSIGLASFLAISSFTPAVLASSANTVEQSVVENSLEEQSETKKTVQQLTLEEAIKYAINSNYSLMELDYVLRGLELSEEEVEQNYDDLTDTRDDLEGNRDRLEDYYDELLNPPVEPPTEEEQPIEDDRLEEQLGQLNSSLASLDSSLSLHNMARIAQSEKPSNAKSSTLQSNIHYLQDVLETTEDHVDEFAEREEQLEETSEAITNIRQQIDSIDGTLKTLESSMKQIESSLVTTENNRKQVVESIRFSTTATFIGLLLNQYQIDFLEETLKTQQQQVNGMNRRFELGLIARKDYNKSTRDITQLELQIKQAKNALKSDKEAFALTIGYSYEDDYEVVAPETGTLPLVSKESSIQNIIENSYNMKNAKEELSLAEEKLSDVRDDYDSTDFAERKAELEVDTKELKVKSLRNDLEGSINKLYSQIQIQYETMKDHESKLEYAKEDTDDLSLYYELGLLSKEKFDSATINIKQAEFNYNNSKYQYYLLLKQVDLLKSGVILN